MKILKQGKTMPKAFKYYCPSCSCKFLVEENDYKEKEYPILGTVIVFSCPNCKEEISARKLHLIR